VPSFFQQHLNVKWNRPTHSSLVNVLCIYVKITVWHVCWLVTDCSVLVDINYTDV